MDDNYMSYILAIGAIRGGASKIKRIDWANSMYVKTANGDNPSEASLILVNGAVESPYVPSSEDQENMDWVCF